MKAGQVDDICEICLNRVIIVITSISIQTEHRQLRFDTTGTVVVVFETPEVQKGNCEKEMNTARIKDPRE